MLFLIFIEIYISISVNNIALQTYIINVYIIAMFIHIVLNAQYEFLRASLILLIRICTVQI
jgi:hypothetical protein